MSENIAETAGPRPNANIDQAVLALIDKGVERLIKRALTRNPHALTSVNAGLIRAFGRHLAMASRPGFEIHAADEFCTNIKLTALLVTKAKGNG
jgi:hypothetical protein